jgi:tryptophan synthase alpha chain
MTTTSPRRHLLEETFARTRAAQRAALIGYLPAGYPNLNGFLAAARALAEHVDILEIGLPHGVNRDLDGPDIFRACQTAMGSCPTPPAAIQAVRELTASTTTPVVVMSYWEPISRRGADKWMAASLVGAGAAGIVLPDIHPTGAAATRWLPAARKHDLTTTFLATADQWEAAATCSSGWIYLPAASGPTGTTSLLDLPDIRRRTEQLRELTSLDICGGIGVSNPHQAAALAPGLNGVIVGTAFVKALADAPRITDGIAALDRLAAEFAAAVAAVRGEQPQPASSAKTLARRRPLAVKSLREAQ